MDDEREVLEEIIDICIESWDFTQVSLYEEAIDKIQAIAEEALNMV